ncbi:MAG: tryptophan--tRNA ligase [Endomicrobium sp.]|jgi:tryptophanyl-tRNA synthetase|nr:tryptophan--tRNA ligase [Endomicrobium sp.]
MKKRILSGMRPTGRLHLGHYFGTLCNWVELQDKYDCYYMSSDWHALTTEYADTSEIRENTFEMIADWITVGLDPKKSVIFKQSAVHQHSELFLIFAMVTPLGWLQRCPTYKDQIREIKNKDLNNYGFLGYPVLMAADILLYKADLVPVGEDQLSHLEFTREIARRFNNFYGKIFIEPAASLSETAKVPGIDGRKMSKSYGNSIMLGEDSDTIKAKVKNMFTDPLKIKKNDIGHPDGCVVIKFYEILSKGSDKYPKFDTRESDCKNGVISCSVCKRQLTDMLCDFMEPLTKRRGEIISDKTYLESVIRDGCKKAESCAANTMAEIRKVLKF